MDKIAQLSIKDRKHIFYQSAIEIENISLITEKDFWVVWAMKHVFSLGDISNHLIFRGGTSLSKAHSIIERFSEDVDLGIDYKYFGFTNVKDPNNASSKSQRIKLIKQFRRKVRQYLETDFKEMLTQSFGKVIKDDNWSLDCHQNGRIIQFYFNYPRSLPEDEYFSDYIRPTVKIEIDPRASLEPFGVKTITPIVAEYFSEHFDTTSFQANTLNAERTFWEKLALLHRIFIAGEKLPERFSRHCYDVVELSNSKFIQETISNFELFNTVIEHNKKFYDQNDNHYLGALEGKLKLTPNDELLSELKNDYIETKNMIFGNEPEFDTLITGLKTLENKLNQMM
jgi:predicted nucleotidyltransferase component of viral defense system